jgi:hypothetical protein
VTNGGGASSAVSLVPASPSVATETFGAPNANPLVVEGCTDAASGVLGGLPKPKPTGFPRLPLPVLPKLKKDPDLGALEALVPNANGVLVLEEGNAEDEAGLPKMLVAGAVSFSFSLSLSLVSPDGWVAPNRLLEKTDGALPIPAVVEAVAAFSPKVNVVPDVAGPNEKADLTGAGADPPSVPLSDLSAALEPNANGLPLEAMGIDGGFDPPSCDGLVEVPEPKVKPAKPEGAEGIANVFFGSAGVAEVAEVATEDPPNPFNGVEVDAAGANSAFTAEVDIFLILASYSDFAPVLDVLYRSRKSAMLTYGSVSTAFLQAARNATLSPRSAV